MPKRAKKMDSEFETILLQDNHNPVVKLEYLSAHQDEQNGNRGQAACPKESKIGEIIHVANDHFKFVCVHCFAEFPLLVQFTSHVQQHLHEIYSDAFDTKVFGDLETAGTEVSGESSDAGIGRDLNEIKQAKASKVSFDHHRYQKSTCTICQREFSNKRSLVCHLRHAHDSCGNVLKSFACYLCHKNFETVAKLRSHYRQNHVAKESTYQRYKYKMRKCQKCGEQFNEVTAWNRHKRRHKEEISGRPHKCNICTKTFVERHELTRHINQHTAPKCRACEICNKSVSNRRMKEHMFQHSGVGKSQCTVCGNFYTDSGRLSRHMRTHTGELPYKCEDCGKCFAQSYNLVNHKRIHTGEFAHRCEPCGKGFWARRELRRHNLRIHGLEMPDGHSSK